MMPIIGVGVDIIHLPRLYRLLTRQSPQRLAQRIFTKVERSLLVDEFKNSHVDLHQPLLVSGGKDLDVQNKRLVSYLGARWAAKEASFKAMYPTYVLEFSDVSITKEEGKPILLLTPSVAAATECSASHISISHDGEYAIAQVIFER